MPASVDSLASPTALRNPDLTDLTAAPLNSTKCEYDCPRSDPAPHVSEQPVRNWRRRLPLLGRTPPLSEPIEDAVFEIDMRSARVTVRRRGRNGAGAGAGIEADQNKARDMTKRALARLNLLILQTVRDAASGLRDIASTPTTMLPLRCGLAIDHDLVLLQEARREPTRGADLPVHGD